MSPPTGQCLETPHDLHGAPRPADLPVRSAEASPRDGGPPGPAGLSVRGAEGSPRDGGPPPPRVGSAVRRLLVMGVLAVALSTAVLAVPTLGSVRADLDAIDGWWAAGAVALEVASCLCFVIVFRAFFEPVAPRVARSVAWIEEGSGALLPGGGLTSYAIGGVILGREGLTVREIVVRSGGLFWFTSAVNAFALVIGTALVVLVPERAEPSLLAIVLPLAVGGPLTVLIAAAPALARAGMVRSARGRNLIDTVTEAWRAARRRSWRLLGAFGYLYFDMLVLVCLFHGLGYAVPLGALTLGYLVGYLATVIPIPGGIGVLEGGLTGALILYGAPPVKTIAVVLVYHAIAFWIPSVGGALGYASLLRQRGRSAPGRDRRSGQAAATAEESSSTLVTS